MENGIIFKLNEFYSVKDSFHGISIKDVDTAKKIVTGFYNVCNYFDSSFDVVLSGAANKSISEKGPNSKAPAKIKHALFHDLTRLPGKIMTLEEKTIDGITGLYFETQMSNTREGIDTLINYQNKIYDNHSIGYRYIAGKLDMLTPEDQNWNKYLSILINPDDAVTAGKMFIVREYDLFEGSTVAFGANKLSGVLGLKSTDRNIALTKIFERIDLLEHEIKSGKQSDEQLRDFQLQNLQLKQAIKEIYEIEPSIKDTLGMDIRECQKCGIKFDANMIFGTEKKCPKCLEPSLKVEPSINDTHQIIDIINNLNLQK